MVILGLLLVAVVGALIIYVLYVVSDVCVCGYAILSLYSH